MEWSHFCKPANRPALIPDGEICDRCGAEPPARMGDVQLALAMQPCACCDLLADARTMVRLPAGFVAAGGSLEGRPLAAGLYHGACVVELVSCEDLLRLPRSEAGKLRLDEVGPTVGRLLLQDWPDGREPVRLPVRDFK